MARTYAGPVRCSLIAILAFALQVGVLNFILPADMPGNLRLRLNHFAERKDEVELLLVGSSFTRTGIDPSVISRVTGLKSYNMAVPAANGHIVNQTLRHVIAMQPRHLKCVVIELVPWNCGDDRLPYFHPEKTWIHTPRETIKILKSVRSQRCSPNIYAYHIGSALTRASGMGRWTQAFSSPDREPSFFDWRPLEVSKSSLDASYARRVKALEPGPAHVDPSTYNLEAILDQAAMVRELGAKIVYLIPPSTESYHRERELHKREVIGPLLDFNRPSVYPKLFESRHRFDNTHLNIDGARIYSQAVGEAIVAQSTEFKSRGR